MSTRRRRRSRRARVDGPPSASPTADLGFRPLRVATILAVITAIAFGIDVASEHAGFRDGFALVCGLLLCGVATPRAIGLWRGTVSHETITHTIPVWRMSLEAVRAFTPCAVIAMDGLLLGFAVLITIGGGGTLAEPVMFAGGFVAVVFGLAAGWAAMFKRPRLLLPKTMRPPGPSA